jgi:hypothetical protein
MKPWEATIPVTPKRKHLKRCYIMWKRILHTSKAGGKIVWLTDKQVTFYQIKYPRLILEEVLDIDTKELYKIYMHQTVD